MFRFHAHVKPGFDHASQRLFLYNMNSHPIDVHTIRYSDEVKRAAVARLLNGETHKQVAADVGCHMSNLAVWKRKFRDGAPLTSTPAARRCPRCAELAAILKLVVETANAAPTIRAGVLRIAVDAIAAPTTQANSNASVS